jgi:hypothetical protein
MAEKNGNNVAVKKFNHKGVGMAGDTIREVAARCQKSNVTFFDAHTRLILSTSETTDVVNKVSEVHSNAPTQVINTV